MGSQSRDYHSLEGPSPVYYEAVQNIDTATRRPTGANHSTEKYNGHYELGHSQETAFNEVRTVQCQIQYYQIYNIQ